MRVPRHRNGGGTSLTAGARAGALAGTLASVLASMLASMLARVLAAVLLNLAMASAPVPLAAQSKPPAAGPDSLEVHGLADYDWSLRTVEGRPVRLEDYRGRVLFINMWASWCTPCIAEMGSIEALRGSLADVEVDFLLISPEDQPPVERFLRRYRYDLPVLLEVELMPDAYGLRALPTTYIVDRHGRIVLKHRGAAEWDRPDVRAFLRALAR